MKLVSKRTRTSKSRSPHRALFRLAVFVLATGVIMAAGIPLSLAHFKEQESSNTDRRARGVSVHKTKHKVVAASFDLDDPRKAALEAEALRLDELSVANSIGSGTPRKQRGSKGFSLMSLVTIVVTNTNDSGAGSLRQAIIDANSDGMPDQIAFNIPTGDPGFNGSTFTIKPHSPLPAITGGDTLIDGTSQTAFTGNTNSAGPEVVLDGSIAGATAGLRIQSPNNTISGLVIDGFSGSGIVIIGAISDRNVVTGCYIGTDPTGSFAVPNTQNGVQMNGGSDHNVIGGTTSGSGNVISGNQGHGIQVGGSFSGSEGNNTIQGNRVGTNAAGTAAIPNGVNGINIAGSSFNNIGGTDAGAGNVCSGNPQSGIRVVGRVAAASATDVSVVYSTGNIIQGNLLGTNAAGDAAIPNIVDGLRLNFGAMNNLVGGATPAARNVCSGDTAHGVHLDASQPILEDDAGNIIPVPFAPVSHNSIQGNFIGTDITGALPIGNTLPGVVAFLGPTDNFIGGINPGEGNTIAFNTGGFVDDGTGNMIFIPGDGVNVAYNPNNPTDDPFPTVGITIVGNSIHSNQGLGIDLSLLATGPDAADGPTPNDPCDADVGPNDFQNAPVLTSIVTSGGSTVVQGTLNSTANTRFGLQFFSNSVCDPSGFGEGETPIGILFVTTGADCTASFTATLPALVCRSVTATATNVIGPHFNTSEFSNCIETPPVVTCSVATSQLWPPDHDLINVGLSATANCPDATISVKVFSDEDDEAPTGDGNFSPDAKDIAAGTLRLRAERDGNLDGRVYLIIVSATDSSGNVSHCCSTVTVPKSQSAASKQSVANQAAAAQAFCVQHGTAPPGYFLVGDGPIVGPKQ